MESSAGCATLALIRHLQKRFDEAIDLSEKSLAIDSNNIEALEVLYDALFHPIYEKWIKHEIRSFDENAKTRLERAEEAVSRAITILREGTNRIKLHRDLSNRAAVRDALGKTDAALSDCDEILHDKTTDDIWDSATFNKAMILISARRHKEAIPLLESLKTPTRIKEAKSSLAYSYSAIGEFSKATPIWESIWNPEECSAGEFVTADDLLSTYRRINDDGKAEEVIEKLRSACPDNYEAQAIIEQDQYRLGNKDGASQKLRDIADACARKGDVPVFVRTLLRLAQVLQEDRMFKESVDVLKRVGWENLLPNTKISYLYSLVKLESDDEVFEIAKRISAEGFNYYAAEVESAILSKREKWAESQAIFEKLIQVDPNNIYHLINHCEVALRNKDLDAARGSLSKISYQFIKNDPDLLRQVSRLQVHFKFKDAIKFAFRARQIDFGNPESHTNMFQVFTQSTEAFSYSEDGTEDNGRAANVLGLNGPRWGEVPCTIRLLPVGVVDERQEQSFTILEEGPFDQPRGIYSSQHPFAKRLLALKAGETISLKEELMRHYPPIDDDRQYRVSTYIHPYVHAFQESMKNAYGLFGREARMLSMDIRGNLSKFWPPLEEFGRDPERLVGLYKRLNCPLSSIGTALNKSVIDLWFELSSERPWQPNSSSGSSKVFEQAAQRIDMEGKTTLVLDSTALIALVQLGLDEMFSSNFRLLVPQSLFDEVKGWCASQSSFSVPAGLPLKICTFVENKTQLGAVTNEHLLPPSDVKRWRIFVGRSELDATLLALEYKGLLYAEDAVIRGITKIQTEIDSVATHHILSHLLTQGKITQEDYEHALERMAEANVQVFGFIEDSSP